MKANAADIIGFLRNEKGFRDVNLEEDFEVQKVHYQPYRDENFYENCLILQEVDFEVNCKHCLILCQNGTDDLYVNEKGVFIYAQNPTEIYIALIRKFALDEPYGINEMQLRNHYFPATYTTVQRCLYDNSQKFGWHQLIGIEGGKYYMDLDPKMPMIGGVKIGKNVIIGNNVIIYRGVTGFTEIGDNCVIEDNCIVAPDSIMPEGFKMLSFTIFSNRK